MGMSPPHWNVITPSQFPWEQEALEYVRQHLPAHEPYRAWANFEFIADDGSINEVDLLVLSPRGFFLVEIKSRPGVIQGDASTWTWKHEGRTTTDDNPVLLANRKAKKLASLLRRQKSCSKIKIPYLDALVFCSHRDQQCQLEGAARYRVCLRDREATADRPARPGIIAAITNRQAEGIDQARDIEVDRPVAKALTRAMEEAGIRQSQRSRKVGDYVLEQLIAEGPGYQDLEATHVALNVKRRIRIYNVALGSSAETRETTLRAARREFQILEGIRHPGVLRAVEYKEHDLGPALVFEYDPKAVRLDHFLLTHHDRLSVDQRIDLTRQIAEVLKHAHEKRLYHRALSPQSILVLDPDAARPSVQIFNWQTGSREAGTSKCVTATQHLDLLMEPAAQAYMAPEALTDTEGSGEELDVFSVGAIAYHLFSGRPPASSFLELSTKVKEGRGLQVSAVLDGACKALQDLIQYSTFPDVTARVDSMQDLLVLLEAVEEELTTPEREELANPIDAKPGDQLLGEFEVKARLGTGACARTLLVLHKGQECVLKVALSPEHNQRLQDEAEVLDKLRHQHIVELLGRVQFGDLFGFLIQKAGNKTLAQRLREEGKLDLGLLERFGKDLLQTIDWLEQKGIPHRDIKPDNIGVSPVGRGDKLHLVLFDFSLSRTPAENIRAGTIPYLDPFLPHRKPVRWDLHAERFAAAMTLYEMATRQLPKWGDGRSDPSVLDCEVTLEAELFDANLREGMAAFFTKALRRDYRQRFGTCEEMLKAWEKIFEHVDRPTAGTDLGEEQDRSKLLETVTLQTQLVVLGLTTRAMNVLDRLNVITVRDLLTVPLMRVYKMRGVGNKTRREIGDLANELRIRFPDVHTDAEQAADNADSAEAARPAVVGLDQLAAQILGSEPKGKVKTEWRVLRAFLGLDELADAAPMGWPSQVDITPRADVTRARVGQIVTKAREKWRRTTSVTALREEIVDIVTRSGGVMTAAELSDAIRAARGSCRPEPQASLLARAVTRAAVETERATEQARCIVRRAGGIVLVGLNQELADYAELLGKEADKLADADPLATPVRALDTLQAVTRPENAPSLPGPRLVQLAAAASTRAALSSRQEIYPVGMPCLRALKLAHGALLGARELKPEELRRRVLGRYPKAEPLPNRPELDQLLKDAGWEFEWRPEAARGEGAYVPPMLGITVTSGTTMPQRYVTAPGPRLVLSDAEVIAAQFEERLRRAIKEGAFLALTVKPTLMERAQAEIGRRFDVVERSMDEMLIRHIRHQAQSARVDWELVRRADAADRTGRDWQNLQILVRRAMPDIERELMASEKTVLLANPGLLARYDQMALLEQLRDKAGRSQGIPGLWVVIPADEQRELPMLDGKPVPVISAAQHARIPEQWLENRHRGVAD